VKVRKYLSLLALALIILLVFVSANFQLIKSYHNTPAGTKYFGAVGFFFDYYQFLSWMKDGTGGRILIASRYIPDIEKPVLLHPFFPAVGLIATFLHLPLFISYHLVKNINLMIFLVSLYFLAKSIFSTSRLRWMAYLLLLFSTGFPKIVFRGSLIALEPLIPFWKTFYTLEKFDYPPHHLLADALFIFLIILIIKTIKSKVTPGVAEWIHPEDSSRGTPLGWLTIFGIAIISILLTLLNPATAVFLLGILGILLVYLFFAKRLDKKEGEIFGRYRWIYLVIIIFVLPILIYNYGIFQTGNPWKYFYLGERYGRYDVSFASYILSGGPLLLSGLLSFVFWSRFKLAEKILGLWLVLPPLMFFQAGKLLPFSMSRVFALNLYIPAALLTAFLWEQLQPPQGSPFGHPWGERWGKMIKSILLLFLIASLFLGGIFSVQDIFKRQYVNYYNVFLPNDLIAAIAYINSHTRTNSTILAGENISNLIPAFLDNHVVLGREDVWANYEQIKNKVSRIFLRETEDGQIISQLKDWRVQYLIFGLDQVGYEAFLKKGTIPQLKSVYKAGDISVVEVL